MKSVIKIFLTLFLLVFLSNCEVEPLGEVFEEEISKGEIIDAELLNILTQVVARSNPEDPNLSQEIVCLDFVYPIRLLIYNENRDIVGTKTIQGDYAFRTFLESLLENQSISVSYPISTTLDDGSSFSVNTNEELKMAIESCSRADIIAYYNGLFTGDEEQKCIWKVSYLENGNNKYVGGYFKMEDDGILSFNYNGQSYLGNWIILYVDDQLNININLAGNSDIALDWNNNHKMESTDENNLTLIGDLNIELKRSCEAIQIYEIGDEGPGEGIVFYDKGSYSDGWRYMETSQTDIENLQWGCYSSQISVVPNSAIGTGLINSALILNYHDSLINFYSNPGICNSENDGSLAAKHALTSSITTSDWFLPSSQELDILYQNLHTAGLGNFSEALYWSSTEFDDSKARAVNFANGSQVNISKIETAQVIKVRAIRYF